jgi:hypothetical protein
MSEESAGTNDGAEEHKPTPETPPEPAPAAPEKARDPEPEVPGPEVPKPEAPKPEVPEPEVPKPEAPKPEVPEPEAPKPEEPPPPAAPSITAVEPDHGPIAGGFKVKVRGSAFVEGARVLLGGEPAPTVFESSDALEVWIPARSTKGLVELRVVLPDGQLALYEEDFRYDPLPSISGIEPAWVSTEGGAVVSVLGAELAKACGVLIDGALVPSSWIHAGRVEAVTKAHPAGEVSLAVKNPDGQTATRERAVRFAAPPRIAGISPATAVTAGGAEITLTGSGFEQGCAVLVAGAPAGAVTFAGETEIRFAAPPHAAVERVDVAVVNPTGLIDRRPLAFAYTKAPPRVDFVTPQWGPSAGGTELVVKGHDLDQGATVLVCGIEAKVTHRSREELRVVTPAVTRDGSVDLRVVNLDDQAFTFEKAFRYLAPLPPPELREVSPRQGSQLGGLEVAILGEGFADGVTVTFGGVPAAVQFLTGKELSVTSPAFAGHGDVTVEVRNPDGVASFLDAAFTYEAKPAPEIDGITPTSGPTTGGTRVVIEGKRFSRECSVFVGREPPRDLVVKSATEIHIVTASRKQSGVVDVEVSIPGAPRAVMKNGFRYDAVPAPVITSVSPIAGTVAGGTEMTVSGKNFLKDSTVLVDGKPAKTVKLVDAGTLELKTPPGDAGKLADVIVRNPDGKEAVQKRAFLYDPRYRG